MLGIEMRSRYAGETCWKANQNTQRSLNVTCEQKGSFSRRRVTKALRPPRTTPRLFWGGGVHWRPLVAVVENTAGLLSVLVAGNAHFLSPYEKVFCGESANHCFFHPLWSFFFCVLPAGECLPRPSFVYRRLFFVDRSEKLPAAAAAR